MGCSAMLSSDVVATHEKDYALIHVELFQSKYLSLFAEIEHNKQAMSHAQSRCRAQETENIGLRQEIANLRDELKAFKTAPVTIPVPGAVNSHMHVDNMVQIDRLLEQREKDTAEIARLQRAVEEKDEWIRKVNVSPVSAAAATIAASVGLLRKAPSSPPLVPITFPRWRRFPTPLYNPASRGVLNSDNNGQPSLPIEPRSPRLSPIPTHVTDGQHSSGSASGGSGSGSDSEDDGSDIDLRNDPNYIPELNLIRGTSRGHAMGMHVLCPYHWKHKAEKFIGRIRSGSDPKGAQES